MGIIALCGFLLSGTGCIDGSSPTDPAPGTETEVGEPSGTAGLYANEPDGFQPLTERHFRANDDDGWRSSDNEFAITRDAGAPVSDPYVGQARFPAGLSGGHSPMWSEREIVEHGKTSLYVSFWLKVSDNWQGHPVNSKIAYVWTHGRPVVFPVYIGGDDAPLTTEVRIQDTPEGSRNLLPNLEDVTVRRGEWVQWELVLVNNTGDRADGEIHWWIDGTKVGQYDDVLFGSASQSKVWERTAWRPVWGGAGGEVREDMYMWMDRFYASGAR